MATWAMHDPAHEIIPLVMLFVNRGRTLDDTDDIIALLLVVSLEYIIYIIKFIDCFCQLKSENCQLSVETVKGVICVKSF